MALLEARQLQKSFRHRRVVDHVSFRVDPGEIVGLLGPNGAGKTTCFRMVLGMVRPDGGQVFLTHTTVNGAAVLRVAIGSPATTRAHVERLWALLRENHDWLATDFAAAAAEREAARAAAELANAREAAVEMRARLGVDGDDVGAGLGEGLEIGIGGPDHQVDVHHRLHMRAQRCDHIGADGDVGHEMAIHHVNMNPVGAMCLDRLYLAAKVGEIGGQDRRGDFDGAIESHGGPPIGFGGS